MSEAGDRELTAGDARAGEAPAPGRVADWLTSVAARPELVLAGIMAAVFAMYAPALTQWFATDDLLLLRAAKTVPFLDYVRAAFDFRETGTLRLYAFRPLYFLSNDVMFEVFGLNAAPYHALSIALHLLNVALVWRLVRRLSGSDVIAHGSAAIFGLHPAYTNTVSWIAGIDSVAATTGMLASMALLVAYHRSERPRPLTYVLSLAAYAVSLLFHQEVFLAPYALYIPFALTHGGGGKAALIRPRLLLSYAPFAAVLAVFLFVQGYTSRETGQAQAIRPSLEVLRTTVAALSLSVAPREGFDVRAVDWALAAVALSATGFAWWRLRERRALIAFAAAWYAAALALSVLYFSRAYAGGQMAALPRKLYDAGPPLALLYSLCLAAAWRELRPRLPEAALLVPLAIAIASALTFAFVRGEERIDGVGRRAGVTDGFRAGLTSAYPSLPDGGTVYLANLPFDLAIFYCDVDGEPGSSGPIFNLCYGKALVEVLYGERTVRVISRDQAQDAAFLAGLRPDDRVFCYRC